MRKNNKGSFIVEAAVAVPIFFFALLVFLYIFKVMLLQLQLQGGLTEAAKELSELGYVRSNTADTATSDQNSTVFDCNKLSQNLIIASEVNKYFPQKDNYSMMLKGNISYYSSSYLEDNDMVDLIGEYNIRLPVPLFHFAEIAVMQRVKTRAFTGTEQLLTVDHGSFDKGEEEDDEYVYITETGTVYHRSLECSSLDLKIFQCELNQVDRKRNSSGGKYQMCEKCCKNWSGITSVYICEDGDAYHTSIECSGLKRTIQKVKLSEVVGEMRACKKCGT